MNKEKIFLEKNNKQLELLKQKIDDSLTELFAMGVHRGLKIATIREAEAFKKFKEE